MAEKRMFSKTIIDSDAFLDMPLSTQALYFHLSMRADDDGFVNNPKKIQRIIGCGDDDLKLLMIKKFLIPFESGIVVIKHWKIHNYIAKDRYKETNYIEEKSLLGIEKNKSYSLISESGSCTPLISLSSNCIQSVYNMDTKRISTGDKLDTQNRIDKNRLEENRIDKNRLNKNRENDDTCDDTLSNSEREADKTINHKPNPKPNPKPTTINNSCSSFKGNIDVFKHFEKCGFIITAMLMEQIATDIEIYNKKWLMEAATEAMNRGKINNYKYVLGILQNWLSQGYKNKNEEGENDGSSSNDFGEELKRQGIGL